MKKVAELGESDRGGIDLAKGAKVVVVTMVEGQNYPLAYGANGPRGAAAMKEAVVIDETGKVTIIIAVSPDNYMVLIGGTDRKDRGMEAAIDAGVEYAGAEIGLGPKMTGQPKEWKLVDFLTGPEGTRTLGIGDPNDIQSMVDVTGQGR